MSQQDKNISELISDRIKGLMQAKGITQAELAKALNVTQGAVSGWCNGAQPRLDQIQRLANFFGVPVGWVITGREESVIELILDSTISAREAAGEDFPPARRAAMEDLLRRKGVAYWLGRWLDAQFETADAASEKDPSPPAHLRSLATGADFAATREWAENELNRNFLWGNRPANQAIIRAFNSDGDQEKLGMIALIKDEGIRLTAALDGLEEAIRNEIGEG